MRKETKLNTSRLVVKFGGSSLSSPQKILRAVEVVKHEASKGTETAVVVSAMGRTTDDLLETVSATSLHEKGHFVDDVLSMGERTSARVFHANLSNQGVRSRYFDPYDDDWPVVTDNRFGDATPIPAICRQRIQRHLLPCLENGIVPVLPGFIGKTADGKITTMGRGGSDITAFLLARYLPADELVVMTDSDGLMTADPKLVRKARRISEISIHELIGLADSGEKFLKTKALQYLDGNFKVRITSNMATSLRSGGTVIVGALPEELTAELESTSRSMMVTITGRRLSQNQNILKETLTKAKDQKAAILGLSANSNSLILYVSSRGRGLVDKIHEAVLAHPEATAVAVRDNLSMIRISGVGLVKRPGLVASVSDPLRLNSVNIYGIFTIASSIVLLVDWNQRQKALHLVKETLRKVTK